MRTSPPKLTLDTNMGLFTLGRKLYKKQARLLKLEHNVTSRTYVLNILYKKFRKIRETLIDDTPVAEIDQTFNGGMKGKQLWEHQVIIQYAKQIFQLLPHNAERLASLSNIDKRMIALNEMIKRQTADKNALEKEVKAGWNEYSALENMLNHSVKNQSFIDDSYWKHDNYWQNINEDDNK